MVEAAGTNGTNLESEGEDPIEVSPSRTWQEGVEPKHGIWAD